MERRLPKITANILLTGTTNSGKQFSESFVYDGVVPEEIMDAYEQVVGNGLARITVGADMSVKDYGTGASAMVSISLACNQDGKTIDKAVELAGELARNYAKEQRALAEKELESLVQDKTAASGNINFR